MQESVPQGQWAMAAILGLEDEKVKNSRAYLTYAVGAVLKTGASLLGIQMPDKM